MTALLHEPAAGVSEIHPTDGDADDLGDGLWAISFSVANRGDVKAILDEVAVDWSDGANRTVPLLIPLAVLSGSTATMAFVARHGEPGVWPVALRGCASLAGCGPVPFGCRVWACADRACLVR